MKNKIKLVISGGGNQLSYLLGIKKYIEDNNIDIDKLSGSSVGSIMICLIKCKVSNEKIIREYSKLSEQKDKDKMNSLKIFIKNVLPKEAYKLCSKDVYISTSLKNKNKFGFKNVIFSDFKSNNQLINSILASCSFPYFINKKNYFKINNDIFIDGFFSNNTPLIKKNNSIDQIIIKPYLIMPLNKFIFSVNKKIDNKLINKGYHDFKKFNEDKETLINFTITNNKYNTKLFIYLIFLIILLSYLFKLIKNIE